MTEQWSLDWDSLAAGAGAVLASVDARGAGGRGLGAHHALHRRLGTVELADQLEVAELVFFTSVQFHKQNLCMYKGYDCYERKNTFICTAGELGSRIRHGLATSVTRSDLNKRVSEARLS